MLSRVHKVIRLVLIVSAAAALGIPEGSDWSTYSLRAFIVVSCGAMAAALSERLLRPKKYAQRLHAERIELGDSGYMRQKALWLLASALVFIVAARFAELSIVWSVLAGFVVVVAVLCLFASVMLQKSRSSAAATESLVGDTLKLSSRHTRWLDSLALLFFALWIYGWWTSGRLTGG